MHTYINIHTHTLIALKLTVKTYRSEEGNTQGLIKYIRGHRRKLDFTSAVSRNTVIA